MWSSGTCVLTKKYFPGSHFWSQCRNRLSLSGTIKGSLFCFLHFCWSQKITAGTRRTRFLSVTVFQRQKTLYQNCFCLPVSGPDNPLKLALIWGCPYKDWEIEVAGFLWLYWLFHTKLKTLANERTHFARKQVCKLTKRRENLFRFFKDPYSDSPKIRTFWLLRFLSLFFFQSQFFDHFPFFSGRETAFFVTAAKNWVDLASLFVN